MYRIQRSKTVIFEKTFESNRWTLSKMPTQIDCSIVKTKIIFVSYNDNWHETVIECRIEPIKLPVCGMTKYYPGPNFTPRSSQYANKCDFIPLSKLITFFQLKSPSCLIDSKVSSRRFLKNVYGWTHDARGPVLPRNPCNWILTKEKIQVLRVRTTSRGWGRNTLGASYERRPP